MSVSYALENGYLAKIIGLKTHDNCERESPRRQSILYTDIRAKRNEVPIRDLFNQSRDLSLEDEPVNMSITQ